MSTPAFGTNPTKTKTYGYDSNGNCTSVGVNTGSGNQNTSLTYDVENRLTGITYPSTSSDTYAYNGNGMRTKKTDSGGTFNYVCDGTTPGSEVLSDGAATYTPGISERRSGASSFYHNDGDGSVGTVTNASQSVTSSKKYDAFGNVVPVSGSGTGPFRPAPLTTYPFGFKGAQQAQTDSSGLILEGDRYYDSDLGRYLSGNYTLGCIGGPDPDPLMDKFNQDDWIDCLLADTNLSDDGSIDDMCGPPKHGGAGKAKPPWEKTYATEEEAARAALAYIMPRSIQEQQEYIGAIVRVKGGYRFTEPRKLGEKNGNGGQYHIPDNAVATYHTHYSRNEYDASDDGDQYATDTTGITTYVGNTHGNIWVNTPRRDHYDDQFITDEQGKRSDPGHQRFGHGAHKLKKGWRK